MTGTPGDDVMRAAFRHPAPYKAGDPNCPGCKAEVVLDRFVAALTAAQRERDEARQRSERQRMNIRALYTQRRAAEAQVQSLRAALGAYRSALRSGEHESEQLREMGEAALRVDPEALKEQER